MYYPNSLPPNDVLTGQYLSLSAFDALVLTSSIVRTVREENGTLIGEIPLNENQETVGTNIGTYISSTTLGKIYHRLHSE